LKFSEELHFVLNVEIVCYTFVLRFTTHPALQSVSMSFISGNLSVLSGGREIL